MKNLKDTPIEERYARKCDVSGKGMNEGWVWCDGVFYTADIDDTLAECIKDREPIIEGLKERNYEPYNEPYGEEEINNYNTICDKVMKGEELSPQELLDTAYMTDYCFWTDWYETLEEEDEWYTKEGKLIEN